MQDMIEPPKIASAVDGQHVEGFLDHADDRAIAPFILADRAGAHLGDVIAGAAKHDPLL